jgi:hypothetical protein
MEKSFSGLSGQGIDNGLLIPYTMYVRADAISALLLIIHHSALTGEARVSKGEAFFGWHWRADPGAVAH